jgi:predicted RNA binding protein with dsRBD fold (UPF0201 family)
VPREPQRGRGEGPKAVLSIFQDAELSLDNGILSGTASLDRFHRIIRNQRILDATRTVPIRNIRARRQGRITLIQKCMILSPLAMLK